MLDGREVDVQDYAFRKLKEKEDAAAASRKELSGLI